MPTKSPKLTKPINRLEKGSDDEESDNSVQKPIVVERKKRPITNAQIEALKKAQAQRLLNFQSRKKEKDDLVNKEKELDEMEAKEHEENEIEEARIETLPIKTNVKKPSKKKVIVMEEEESSSSEEEVIIVKPKKKKVQLKRTKKQPKIIYEPSSEEEEEDDERSSKQRYASEGPKSRSVGKIVKKNVRKSRDVESDDDDDEPIYQQPPQRVQNNYENYSWS
jgi:hypothetical protein